MVACEPWPVMALGLPLDELIVVIEKGVVVSQSPAVAASSSKQSRSLVGMSKREAESRVRGLAAHERDISAELKAFDTVIAALETITPWVTMSEPGIAYFESASGSKFYGSEQALCKKVVNTVTQALATLGGQAEAKLSGEQFQSLADQYAQSFVIGVSNGYFASWLATQASGSNRYGASRLSGLRSGISGSGGVVDRHSGFNPESQANPAVNIIQPDATRDFVSAWPIEYLEFGRNYGVIAKLLKLGIRTIGDWITLPAGSVNSRFGTDGMRLYRMASGQDEVLVTPTEVENRYSYEWVFQAPTVDSRQCGHAAAALAEELISDLEAAGTSCVRLSVMAETETTETFQRYWRFSGLGDGLKLTPADVAKRVSWQIDSWISANNGLQSPVARLVIEANQLMPTTGKQLSLLDEQCYAETKAVRRLTTRLSALVGEVNVAVASLKGGYALVDRAEFVPAVNVDLETDSETQSHTSSSQVGTSSYSSSFQTRTRRVRRSGIPKNTNGPTLDCGLEPGPNLDAPWPGSIPKPSPTKVLTTVFPAKLLDEAGQLIGVTARGELTSLPHCLTYEHSPHSGSARPQSTRPKYTQLSISSWAGPWLDSRAWWKNEFVRAARMQVVVDSKGYLLKLCDGEWFIEASYE